MLYVICSIICSVFVGVSLKIVKKGNGSFQQIITWNYLFAILLTYSVYKPKFTLNFDLSTEVLLVTLSILLPFIFIFQAKAIKYNGIVKTDIAQRLSLIISLICSYFVFKDTFNSYKIIGIVFAFVAIFFTLYKKNSAQEEENKPQYLFIILLGFGVIDVLFKAIAGLSVISFTEVLYLVFIGAFIMSSLISIYTIIKKKELFDIKNALWGLAVGGLNFGNICFYIKAHQALSNNPSTVFAGMNMGVILLGSCIGILIFKERVTKLNYIGILLAIISIVFITYSQLQ